LGDVVLHRVGAVIGIGEAGTRPDGSEDGGRRRLSESGHLVFDRGEQRGCLGPALSPQPVEHFVLLVLKDPLEVPDERLLGGI
jgi:hypothetical protein